jgi:hypothetical protein
MAQTGPTQPFAGGGAVQENFRQMVDHVLSYNPDVPPQLVKRRLNTRLRQVQDRRMWGGLLVRGELSVPAAYTTGDINATRGSNVITGNATLWPVSDLVSTTLATAITATGEYQDVYPTSMTGIDAGDWLLFDDGLATQEVVLVLSVGSTSFKAKPTIAHGIGASITKSSLVRRQWRLGVTRPFYNIRAVTASQTLLLDLPYGHSSATSVTYQICQAYVSLGQNMRMVWSVVNTAQGWRLRLNMPQEVLNTYDSWRQTTGWVYMLNDYIPDEIGRFQYELYPTPSMEQGFPYLAYRTVENMVEDEDTPPPAIPSHMLVNGAIADVMLYNRKSAYYDPTTSAEFNRQSEQDYLNAAMADDSIYMNNLMWAFSRYPFTQHGANYWQSHDVDSVMGYV